MAHQISHKAFSRFQHHMQQVQSPQQLCSLALVGFLLQQRVEVLEVKWFLAQVMVSYSSATCEDSTQ